MSSQMNPTSLSKFVRNLLLAAGTAPLASTAPAETPVAPEAEEIAIPQQRLAELVLTASPLERTLFELAQPATVVTGRDLQLDLQPSLGETLDGQPGVSSTSFGPGASRPIIRGLGDDRLRVLQNGTSVLDAANVGQDHAVGVDPLSVTSVEIVRGPATLMYGPNAIGGVVNVIDNRVPDSRPANGLEGAIDGRLGSADGLRSLSGAVTFDAGPFVFHLDGFARRSNDLRIPGFARSARLRAEDPLADEPRNRLPNSSTETEGGAIGGSYLWDSGYVGLSFSAMNSVYGVVVEDDVVIDLRQQRWDLRGAFYDPASWLKEINYKVGYTDYEHDEVDEGEVDTEFAVSGVNARTEFRHQSVGVFEGAFGMELSRTDFSAVGDEAFVPPTDSESAALFFFEEADLDPYRLQFGARYDYQSHETDDFNRNFNAFSGSAGVIFTPVENHAISLSAAYSQRPPTYLELYADGVHIGTGLAEFGDPDLGTEDSFSLDLSLRRKAGRVTGSASAFYYRFSNFINLQPTGNDIIENGQAYPEHFFRPTRADFIGGELEAVLHILEPMAGEDVPRDESLDLSLAIDYVRAQNRDDRMPMPRIPPFRATTALDYQRDNFGARLKGRWAARQNRTGREELATDSHFLLSLALTYQFDVGRTRNTAFVKGTNLTDAEVRQSTSFIKDSAPLAGRGVMVGMRSEF